MSIQDVLTSFTCDGRVQSRQMSIGYAASDKRLLVPGSGCTQLFASSDGVLIHLLCLWIYFIYSGSCAY